MTNESKRITWYRYLRHTFAVVIFAYAIWHWREFPVWAGLLLVGEVLAVLLFSIGLYWRMERKPYPIGHTAGTYIQHTESLVISDKGMTYDRRRNRPESIRWDDVTVVEIVREIDWDMMLINFYWRVVAPDGRYMRIWEEDDGYRDRLMCAFEKYLPQFSSSEALNCFQSKDSGRWTCFDRSVQQK